MCGIVGSFHTSGAQTPAALLKRMTDAMKHRGPDGEGFFFASTKSGRFECGPEPRCGIDDADLAFGHRRLAILDLSEAGRQPMMDASGSFAITYNGEIYNHAELRLELEEKGVVFRSRTDTETVLQAYAIWGESCVERFNGMFAFAIWDRANHRLFLARDRFGVKPLYYFADAGTLLFASEIKAMLPHPALKRRVCPGALNEYFTFQNVLTDRTLFDGVLLLPAGHTLTLDLADGSCGVERRLRKKQYWDFAMPEKPLDITLEEAAEESRRLFEQAVKRQLMSDVPVGAFLSGGMDSGAICAVASRHLGRMSTFTGGFDLSSASGLELGFDERAQSERLANHLKSEHYEMVMHAGDMEHVMPELVRHLEDLRVGQCYPNYYVSRLAGRFVKVCLSGAGGDELFAGYPWRYHEGTRSRNREEYLRTYYDYWQRLVSDDDKSRLFRPGTLGDIDSGSSFRVFHDVFNGFNSPLEAPEDYLNASLYFESKTFLHGLLVVEDKVSMAHSLEVRLPFLDNDLVAFALSLPARHKLRNWGKTSVQIDEDDVNKRHRYEMQTSDGKLVLREAMSQLIPADVIHRKKQGFSAPDASWFRGESIDYIKRLLHERDARLYQFIEPAFVESVLDEHCSGRANHRLLIWSFLSFEWWCRQFLDGSA